MKSKRDNTHSFIVRVWIEQRKQARKRPDWRGVIENVTTGERRGINSLFDVTAFIQEYLERLGVKFSKIQQVLQCMKACSKNRPKDQ